MVGARGFWLNGFDKSEGVFVNKDEADDEENSRGGASGCGIWSRYLIVFFKIKKTFLNVLDIEFASLHYFIEILFPPE